MTTFTQHKPGTFCWIELATTDTDAAKRFYGALFGWTFEDMPAGPDMTYTMVSLDKRHVGALYKMNAEMVAAKVPTHWASYVSVEDVDATVKTVQASGGKVMKEAFDVMEVGRMAVIEDPAGAMLYLWQPKQHIGAGVKGEPGSLCWNEVFTTNVDRAGKFYSTVLGWKTEAVDMGPMGTYTLFKLPGDTQNVGGMMPMPPNMKGAPSFWLAYLQVDDCDASTKKASDLGAKTMMPPMDIPNIGRFSIVQDPTGATFALYKNLH
jgi:uncharacterized protein